MHDQARNMHVAAFKMCFIDTNIINFRSNYLQIIVT